MRVNYDVDGFMEGVFARSDWIKIQLMESSIGGGSVKGSW